MPIPDFQSLMLPLLIFTTDGNERTVADLAEELAKKFNLSDEETKELLPSGRQSRFRNRVAWAVVYLTRAGLLLRKRRGVFQITSRGQALLKENPDRISIKTLLRYEEFRDFRRNFASSSKNRRATLKGRTANSHGKVSAPASSLIPQATS